MTCVQESNAAVRGVVRNGCTYYEPMSNPIFPSCLNPQEGYLVQMPEPQPQFVPRFMMPPHQFVQPPLMMPPHQFVQPPLMMPPQQSVQPPLMMRPPFTPQQLTLQPYEQQPQQPQRPQPCKPVKSEKCRPGCNDSKCTLIHNSRTLGVGCMRNQQHLFSNAPPCPKGVKCLLAHDKCPIKNCNSGRCRYELNLRHEPMTKEEMSEIDCWEYSNTGVCEFATCELRHAANICPRPKCNSASCRYEVKKQHRPLSREELSKIVCWEHKGAGGCRFRDVCGLKHVEK